ncbi:hypothetical protein ANCDUO_09385 [Ancylostoma duodenale]|uniref:Uncharacterized protein n=1 Tax=Ancylostoma duodenale TaxID=51022 RepID=A0A0C2CU18_9BILA|nr:hypothetical protein ANCDUO_09385 [Ancylostoma duodenale]
MTQKQYTLCIPIIQTGLAREGPSALALEPLLVEVTLCNKLDPESSPDDIDVGFCDISFELLVSRDFGSFESVSKGEGLTVDLAEFTFKPELGVLGRCVGVFGRCVGVLGRCVGVLGRCVGVLERCVEEFWAVELEFVDAGSVFWNAGMKVVVEELGKHVHGSLHDITTADFFASFSSREHFLGAETNNLLRMKCHANFYERVKSTLHKDISSASNVVVAEEAPSIPLPPLQPTMPEVSVDNKTTCIRPNPEAEIRLTVIICNIATVSANFSQATPKQLPRKIWTRTSYSRAKEDGARGGVAELDADVHSKRDLAKESRRTLQTRAGVAAQYLRHNVEIPSETELGFSLPGSSQSRMRPVKRKMSSESSFEAGGASITEIIPMVSKSTRKSAKLDPHKVTTGVADISPKESFSYTLDGNRAFEQSSSSRLSPIPHDEGEADIRRGRIEPTRVRDRLSLEEDMKMMQSSMSEQQRQKMRGRTSEGFVVTSKKDLSSPPSKAHKTEVPSTSRSRTRRTEGSGSNPHAHKIPSAQAIIEAWRASSFEVLPQESLLTPTQRESTGKRAFHGIPTTLPVSDSFSLGHSRRSKVAAQSSALPSKSRDSKEEVNVEVAASTSTDRKAKQRDPVLPSRTVREKTAPQEDIKKRTLRSDSSANSSSEANPVAQATPEVTKVVGHRSRSPQKKNVQLQKVDAISAKEDVVKTTRSSKRDTNIPRVVTFESSPMSSPERMTRRSGSDQNLRRSRARRPQIPTLQPQPSSQRPKTPTQRPQAPAQRPRTPTQHSKAQTRLLESATTEQPPKTSTQQRRFKEYLPHVSTVNALLVLRSLENGWAAPDPNTGQLLGEAIKTMLADRIDAAAHARKSPFGGEVAARFNFEHSPKNR